MKNIFRFMGIALIATSLMVACGKEENEPTDTTDDTTAVNPQPQPQPQPQGPANIINITWKGSAQNIGWQRVSADNTTNLEVYLLEAAQAFDEATSNVSFPYFKMLFMNSTAGFVSTNEDWLILTTQQGDEYNASDIYPSDIYDTSYVALSETNIRGDYWYYSFNTSEGTYGEFDATSMVLASCELNMKYFNVWSYIALASELNEEDYTSDEEWNAALAGCIDNADKQDVIVRLTDFCFAL